MAALSTASHRGELHTTHSAVPQPFHLSGGAYSCRGFAESYLITLHSVHGREGSFCPGCVPTNDMVNFGSVVSIKHGNFGYQVDEFT